MACPNATQVLNALELRILDATDKNTKHALIVGAGDGRLANAMRKHVSDEITFTLIEPKASLRKLLGEFENVGADPFDVEWIKEQVEKKGAIDSLIFYNIHEYWQANLNDFRQIVGLLSEEGKAWVSFLNGSARNVMHHFLPQDVASYGGLAQPAAVSARMSYGSWISYLSMMFCQTEQVWALLDPETYEFVQNAKGAEGQLESIELKLRELTLKVTSLQDAFMWGGMFVAVQFRPQKANEESKAPMFTAAAFNSNLYQSLLVPYPDNSLSQVSDFLAETEAKQWEAKEAKELNPIGKLLLKEIEAIGDVKSLLLIGAGWGRDLYLLKQAKPEWTITGLESSPHKVALGKKVFSNSDIDLRTVDPEVALPFEDASFDLVVTSGFLCQYHAPVSNRVISECTRVGKKGVFHLEDARGPVQSLQLKTLTILQSYKQLGFDNVALNPVQVGEKHTGFVISKMKLEK